MKKIFQISSCLWIAIILTATLLPGSVIDNKWNFTDLIHLDKLIHFAMFYLLSIFAYAGFIEKSNKKNIAIILLLVISFGLGGLIEILQSLLPIHRTASVFDFIADITGSLFGLFFIHLYLRRNGNNNPLS